MVGPAALPARGPGEGAAGGAPGDARACASGRCSSLQLSRRASVGASAVRRGGPRLAGERRPRSASVWRILALLRPPLPPRSSPASYAASLLPRDPLGWMSSDRRPPRRALAAGWIVLSHGSTAARSARSASPGRAPRRASSGLGLLLGGGLLGVAAALLVFLTGAARFAPTPGRPPDYLVHLAVSSRLLRLAAAAGGARSSAATPSRRWWRGSGRGPAVLISSARLRLAARAEPEHRPAGLREHLPRRRAARPGLPADALPLVRHRGAPGLELDDGRAPRLPGERARRRSTPRSTTRSRRAPTGGRAAPSARRRASRGPSCSLVGIAWLLRTRHLRESAAMRAMEPLVDARLAPGSREPPLRFWGERARRRAPLRAGRGAPPPVRGAAAATPGPSAGAPGSSPSGRPG